MLKTIAVVCSAAAGLLVVGEVASAQYGSPPIIIQTPRLPPPQINNPTNLKPLNGPALKDLPSAPTAAAPAAAAPAPAAAKPCRTRSNC
jgi:hypothetical protein